MLGDAFWGGKLWNSLRLSTQRLNFYKPWRILKQNKSNIFLNSPKTQILPQISYFSSSAFSSLGSTFLSSERFVLFSLCRLRLFCRFKKNKKMSFRDDNTEEGRNDLRRPFLHTGSWYRMGSRQSSMLESSQVIRDSSISVLACVLIVALGPIQFGFTVRTT